MKDSENLYDKIRELIGKDPGNLNIMEGTIDVDLQVEYFEFSKKISQQYNDKWALDQMELLRDPEVSNKSKKKILARLATIEDVAAYRAIETYAKNPEKGLRDWSILALHESKMHLESHLLEENQVFISTGLGGKDNKLRYFVVLIARSRKNFSDFQKNIIRNEFPFILKKYDAEIENSEICGYLANFSVLLPIQYAVKDIFAEGIDECNQYGDFLRDTFIVTNVKKLTFEEVTEFIEQKGSK